MWQLVRASTAAPTYFPPEVIEVGPRQWVFVDGGVTMYNNPAFQLFLMATLDRYWPLGAGRPARLADRCRPDAARLGRHRHQLGRPLRPRPGRDEPPVQHDQHPRRLMYAALNEQDLLCRVFGDCRCGDPIDRELGDLVGSSGPLPRGAKLFTYLRYDAELTRAGLAALGCRTSSRSGCSGWTRWTPCRSSASSAKPRRRRYGPSISRASRPEPCRQAIRLGTRNGFRQPLRPAL